MVIKVKTDKDRYFNQLLTLLGGFPPFSVLTIRERDLLSRLYSKFYSTTGTEEKRFAVVFGLDHKQEIRLAMDISKDNLNNLFSSLRKKGFISYDFIYKERMIRPDNKIVFEFTK